MMSGHFDGMDPKLAAKVRVAGPILAISLGYWTPEALEALITEVRTGALTEAEVEEVFDAVRGAHGS